MKCAFRTFAEGDTDTRSEIMLFRYCNPPRSRLGSPCTEGPRTKALAVPDFRFVAFLPALVFELGFPPYFHTPLESTGITPPLHFSPVSSLRHLPCRVYSPDPCSPVTKVKGYRRSLEGFEVARQVQFAMNYGSRPAAEARPWPYHYPRSLVGSAAMEMVRGKMGPGSLEDHT